MKKRIYFIGIAVLSFSEISFSQTINLEDSLINNIVEIEEIVVTGSRIKHDNRSDEYIITPELRRGAVSVYDIFSRLPGVIYNNLNNSVSVRMDNNTLIEVNGKRVSQENLMALPIDRISRIQIIYVPTARYTTEGIHYLINIKLKNDYEGHDLFLGNFTMLSSGNNNGTNIIPNEQPKVQYTYSGKNIDVTAGYGFATIHWNYPVSFSRDYNRLISIISDDVNSSNPNDLNSTISNATNLGIDWQINPNQILSFRALFQNNINKHISSYNIFENVQGYLNNNYFESLNLISKENDFSGALYYKGTFKNQWNIYSSIGYNNMIEDQNSEFVSYNFNNSSPFKNIKNLFRGEIDIIYSFNNSFSLNLGYRGIYNRYDTYNQKNGSILSKYDYIDHKGYIFLDWTPRDNIFFHFGTELDLTCKRDLGNKYKWKKLLPQVTATWHTKDNIQLMLGYSSKLVYPSLFQVSPIPSYLDRWLIWLGNPLLLPARHQVFSLQGTIFDSLIIGAEFSNVKNSLTDWYERTEYNTILKTYVNAKKIESRLVIAYDWMITKELTWSNILQWQWQKISGFDHSNHNSNLSWHSYLEYWIKSIGVMSKVEYIREMQKKPLLQGWQDYGQDLWQVSLQKNFINNTLSISLNYIPPIHLGVRINQESFINTSFFNQKQKLNLSTYDNLLMLRVQWRFNNGHKKKRQVQQYEFEIEKKQEKGLL